jgi:hypothetical protein
MRWFITYFSVQKLKSFANPRIFDTWANPDSFRADKQLTENIIDFSAVLVFEAYV